MEKTGRVYVKLGVLNALLELGKKAPANGSVCIKIELENGTKFLDRDLAAVTQAKSTCLQLSTSNVNNKLEYAFDERFRTVLMSLNADSLSQLINTNLAVSLMLSEGLSSETLTCLGTARFPLINVFQSSDYSHVYPTAPIAIIAPNPFFKESNPPSIDLTIYFDVDLSEFCFGCSSISLLSGSVVGKLASQICPVLPSEDLLPLLPKLTSSQLQEVALGVCSQENACVERRCILQLGHYQENLWVEICSSLSYLPLTASVNASSFSKKYIPPAPIVDESKAQKPPAKAGKPGESKVEESYDPQVVSDCLKICESTVMWSFQSTQEPFRFLSAESTRLLKENSALTCQNLIIRLLRKESNEVICEGPIDIAWFSSRSGLSHPDGPILAILGQVESPTAEARILMSIIPPLFQSDAEIAYAKSKGSKSTASLSGDTLQSSKAVSNKDYSLEFAADLIPTKRKLGTDQRGRDFSQELRLEIKRIAEEIAVEYVTMFPTAERAAEFTKEDKEKELYQRLHLDGLYFTFKEQLKPYVQRYVRNLHWIKPCSPHEEDVMLANLYNELLQQATMSMNSLFNETAMKVEDDECLDPSGVDDRRETTEEKVERLQSLAVDDEANLEWSKGDYRYRNSIAVLEERIKLVSRVTQELKRRNKQIQYGSMVSSQSSGVKQVSKERKSLLAIPILDQPFQDDEAGKLTLLLSRVWMDYALYRLRKLSFHRQSLCAKRIPSLPGDSVDFSISRKISPEIIAEEFSLAESSLQNSLSINSDNVSAMTMLCCLKIETMDLRDAVVVMEDLLNSILSKLSIDTPHFPVLSDSQVMLDWMYGPTSFLWDDQSRVSNMIDCRVHTLACIIFELRELPILSRLAINAAVSSLRSMDPANASKLMDGVPRRSAVSAFLDLSECLLSYGMTKQGERCLNMAKMCEKASSEKAAERNLPNECPKFHRAWLAICESMLMFQTNNFVGAMTAAETSIAISPDCSRCWKCLCDVQFLNSDDQSISNVILQCSDVLNSSTNYQSQQYLAPLTKLDDQSVLVQIQRLNLFVGHYLHKSCHFDEAMSLYMGMAKKTPTCSILREIGYLCLKLNRLEDAENILVQANLLDNNDPKTWGLLATLCLACGEHRQQQAELSLKQALRLEISHPAILREMAMRFMEIDRHETAEDLLRRSLAVESNSMTRRMLADVLNAQNSVSEAVEEYKRALVNVPSVGEKERIQSSMTPLLRILGTEESSKMEHKR